MKRFLIPTLVLFLIVFVAADSKKEKFEGEPGDGVFPVIDVHTHNHFTGKLERTSQIPDTQEQYLKEMKQRGVVGAVVHTGTDLKELPDLSVHKVIYCAGIGSSIPTQKIESGLKSGKYKCIKIYLGYNHHYAYEKLYQPVYKLAEKYNVPVVFHTGDTYSSQAKLKYADPLTIDEVAVDHPKVKFVIAHCGNPWIESAAEVAYKNPNVYLDVSAFWIGDLTKLTSQQKQTYIVTPIKWIFWFLDDPSKMMYGTDWPLTNMKDYLEIVKSAIPREHWKAFFYDNAVQVFNFKI